MFLELEQRITPGVKVFNVGTTLIIKGTPGRDHVHISMVAGLDGSPELKVQSSFVDQHVLIGIEHIMVRLGRGHDVLNVDVDVKLPISVWGAETLIGPIGIKSHGVETRIVERW